MNPIMWAGVARLILLHNYVVKKWPGGSKTKGDEYHFTVGGRFVPGCLPYGVTEILTGALTREKVLSIYVAKSSTSAMNGHLPVNHACVKRSLLT